MNEDPEGELLSPASSFSNGKGSQNFFKKKSTVFFTAIGVIFILIFAVGSAKILGLFQKTFVPQEKLIGEIRLDDSVDSVAKPAAKPKTAGSASPAAVSPVKKIGAVSDAKSAEVLALEGKMMALETQMAAILAAVQKSNSNSNPTSTISQTQPPVQEQSQQSQSQGPAVQQAASSGQGRILVSEIMAGADGNGNYEFVELYNADTHPIDLTGWSIKKKSSSGSESSLVAASRLAGKVVQPGHYLLLGNETGYQGSIALDVPWPPSYALAYKNNAVVVYDSSGAKTEEVAWEEILKNQSVVRAGWNGNQFIPSETPSPQNSQTI